MTGGSASKPEREGRKGLFLRNSGGAGEVLSGLAEAGPAATAELVIYVPMRRESVRAVSKDDRV